MSFIGRILFILCLTFMQGYSQSSIKLMAYNLLNYPNGSALAADTATRHPAYRTTVAAAQPDILVTEEMNSQAGVIFFLNSVMNVNSLTYSAGTFNDGPDTDNSIFFKTSLFSFVSNTPIHTALRDISEFKLVYLATGDTLRIYAVHLKASSGVTNEAQRSAEVDSLRKVTNSLPSGSKFFVCGDFNFYSSTEAAYIKLLQVTAGKEGQFNDPITGMTGTWNNVLYSQYHTQSPRVRAFGGGSTGGMDDRFDLILYSKAVNDGNGMAYLANSMTAFGNDGNHYNDSINHMPNAAVSQAVAEAIYAGSDHIPVFATFTFPNVSADLGATAFIAPIISTCSTTNKTLTVRITNYSSVTHDFSGNPVTVTLNITPPSGPIQTITQTISSGTLAPSATLDVVITSAYNFNQAGIYTFNAFTTTAGDINNANNAMTSATLTVSQGFAASISPSSSVALCSGNSQQFTASAGVSFLWSQGSTSQSIVVNAAGNYSVTVTDANGCSANAGPVTVTVVSQTSSGIVFQENIGSVTGTTAIATHETNNGFQNTGFTMSGTGDVRNTSMSSSYTGASGNANVFLTTTLGKNLIISGINTVGKSNLQLSFGLFRSDLTNTGSTLLVQYSTDGITYANLTVPVITSSSVWNNITVSGVIPSTPNLRLQWKQNGTTCQYRIDDVVLNYSPIPTITVSGPTTFCAGDSVMLSASVGSNYLWSNGAITQSISVKTTGNYSVLVDCIASATQTVTVNSCSFIALNLKLFIQGFYLGGGIMQPVAFNNGLTNDPTVCDYITVELHHATAPFSLVSSVSATLKTNGDALANIPNTLPAGNYYIVIRHRNSIEVWSKLPVSFGSSPVAYDFSL